MGNISSYKELLVWQKGIEIAKLTYSLLKKLPDSERFVLTQQAKRSAISIPSNIAEGWGRRSTKNYLQFLRVASGSLYELETQFTLSVELGYLTTDDCLSIFELIDEESRMLNSLMTKLDEKLKASIE